MYIFTCSAVFVFFLAACIISSWLLLYAHTSALSKKACRVFEMMMMNLQVRNSGIRPAFDTVLDLLILFCIIASTAHRAKCGEWSEHNGYTWIARQCPQYPTPSCWKSLASGSSMVFQRLTASLTTSPVDLDLILSSAQIRKHGCRSITNLWYWWIHEVCY